MKRFVLLLLGLAAAPLAHAQFGAKAGVNAAVLDGKIDQDTRYKTYYHAGLLYEIKVAGPVSVQPELLYSLQGTETRSVFENFDTKLHYLTVPLLVKLHLGPLFVEAGPQIGLLLAAHDSGTKNISTVGGPTQYGSVNRQVTAEYKRGDFGACTGLGLKFGPVLVGGRFNAGLSDINDVKSLSGLSDPKLHNRVFQAYVALQLGDD